MYFKGTLPDRPAFCSLGLFLSSIFRLTVIVAVYGNKNRCIYLGLCRLFPILDTA